MKAPAIPDDEEARLAALESYAVMDTAPEQAFDDLTALAAHILDVPIALVSLVDADRQWFKSRYGLDAPETPRDVSFCGHVVAESKLLVVPDAHRDERFHDNPLVTGDPRVRFYAGVPLLTSEGHTLGTLCAIDHEAREVPAEKVEALQRLGRQVMTQLELRRQVTENRDYAQLFALTDVLHAVAGYDGHFKRLNSAWSRLLGHSDDELRSRPFVEFIHPDDVEATTAEAGRLAREAGTTVDFTNRYRCADGSYRHLSWHAVADPVSEQLYAVAHDITDMLRSERAAVDGAARLGAVLESAVDGIVTIDARGTIETINPAVETLFGYAADELVGRNVSVLMPSPYRDEHDGYLERYARTGNKKIIGIGREVEAQRRDGTVFPIELSISEMRIGSQPKYTGIIRDISERRKIDRLKSEFISTVSHELRTPLTSIRGSLGLLAGGVAGEIPERAREMITIAMSNSERLVRLINDILDIEKIESGRMEFALRAVDLMEVVRDAMASNEGFAREHNTRIVLDPASENARVRIDPDRLTQVLTNLLSNAAKYSPPGQPIEVVVEPRGSRVRVSVRDHGPGIPEEFERRIFQRFAQADSSDTRQKGGTGLGLSIAKAIVERLDGEIGFEAASPGTRFHFDLPALAVASEEDGAVLSRPHILICEDEPDIALLLRKILGAAGFASSIAADAAQAHALLAENRYDLVTVDLKLGADDGLALLRELRSAPETRDLPVVVLSANAETGKLAFNGGAVEVADWLTKPIDEPRLLEVVNSAIHGEGDAASGAVRFLHVEDDADLRTMMGALLSDLGTVTAAATVREASDLLQKQRFDLVLLDLGLPDGSGADLIPMMGDTPVVIFSADEPDSVLASRVASVLVKSRATEAELKASISRLLERRS